jgi:hypothetical protein
LISSIISSSSSTKTSTIFLYFSFF